MRDGEYIGQLLNATQVARRLGRSRSWFYEHRAELERASFPQPVPIVDRWNPKAIDDWVATQGRMLRAVQQHRIDKDLDAAFGLN